jgi:uncharacterized membrane protein HdeD (DUF308 family)
LTIDPMLQQHVTGGFRRYWWLFLIRGLFGLALGVFALTYPGATLAAVVLLIGAYLIVDGIIAVAKAIQILRTDQHWWVLMIEGILGIVVGLAIFLWPGITAVTLAFLVGYWAIISGVFTIAGAVRIRGHVGNEILYLFFGIVSVVFGVFVLYAPAAGLAYIVIATALYGFFMGFTMIALAFRARSLPA